MDAGRVRSPGLGRALVLGRAPVWFMHRWSVERCDRQGDVVGGDRLGSCVERLLTRPAAGTRRRKNSSPLLSRLLSSGLPGSCPTWLASP